jgi:hypothetical protein
LGHAWLFKARPLLLQIYDAEDDSLQVAEDSVRSHVLRSMTRSVSRKRGASRERTAISAEDTARVTSLNYVEARSLLRPALESFDKAIEHGELQGTVTGELLELVCNIATGKLPMGLSMNRADLVCRLLKPTSISETFHILVTTRYAIKRALAFCTRHLKSRISPWIRISECMFCYTYVYMIDIDI